MVPPPPPSSWPLCPVPNRGSQRFRCCPRMPGFPARTPASITGPHLMLWAGAGWATQGHLDADHSSVCLVQEAVLAQRTALPRCLL